MKIKKPNKPTAIGLDVRLSSLRWLTQHSSEHHSTKQGIGQPHEQEVQGTDHQKRGKLAMVFEFIAVVNANLQVFLLELVQEGSDSLQQVPREIVSCHRVVSPAPPKLPRIQDLCAFIQKRF